MHIDTKKNSTFSPLWIELRDTKLLTVSIVFFFFSDRALGNFECLVMVKVIVDEAILGDVSLSTCKWDVEL